MLQTIELINPQRKAIRLASKTLVESIKLRDLSEDLIPSKCYDELDNFKKSIKVITGRSVKLSDTKIVEMCLQARHCLSPEQVQMLFLDDRRYEQIKDEKRQKYQAELDAKIEDIRQGMSKDEFCKKYLVPCLQYYGLRNRYVNA